MATWYSCSEPPKGGEEDYGSYSYSRPVLILDSRGEYNVGYYQDWYDEEDREEWNKWIIKGRDGYTLDDPVAWQDLPEVPWHLVKKRPNRK